MDERARVRRIIEWAVALMCVVVLALFLVSCLVWFFGACWAW